MLDSTCLHRRAARVLPERLHTRAVVGMPDDDAGRAALMLPLRHVHAGSLCFELDDDTAHALLQDPWPCLRDARRARHGLGRRAPPLAYAPWRLVDHAGTPVYRTHSSDGRATLWLLPLRRLLVYCWDDRARIAAMREGCGTVRA